MLSVNERDKPAQQVVVCIFKVCLETASKHREEEEEEEDYCIHERFFNSFKRENNTVATFKSMFQESPERQPILLELSNINSSIFTSEPLYPQV